MTVTIAAKRLRSRRTFLLGAAGAIAINLVPVRAWATPETMAEAIRDVFGDSAIQDGKVTLTLPSIAENGNSVPLVVDVDSAMTEADHVRSLHIFSEKNPLPDVARFHLGPRAGKARVSTRVRLADSQTLTAIATMNDGSLWSGTATIVVTLAACIDLT